MPGFIRIDSVHEGDRDGVKVLYYINAPGFHADNSSEYINYQIAGLLEKLRIEFTKSRPRHSNDNALAESRNSAVVREHLGNAHTPQYLSSCRQHKQADQVAGEKLDLIYDALLEHLSPMLDT